MALKLVVDSLEGLAADVSALYHKRDDGKFALEVDGIQDAAAVDSALKTEREARKTAETARKEAETARKEAEKRAKKFDGLGMSDEEIDALVTRFKNDEEGQLLAKGKVDEVFNKRTEKMRADYANQLKAKDEEVKKEQERTSKYTGKVLENSIRQAATAVGVHANAVEDALLRARGVFSLDEDGNPIAMKDGTQLYGKDGKPLTLAEWMESMREKAPHWFPVQASGSGARQSNGSGSGKRTMKRAEFAKLSPAEQREVAKGGVITVVD